MWLVKKRKGCAFRVKVKLIRKLQDHEKWGVKGLRGLESWDSEVLSLYRMEWRSLVHSGWNHTISSPGAFSCRNGDFSYIHVHWSLHARLRGIRDHLVILYLFLNQEYMHLPPYDSECYWGKTDCKRPGWSQQCQHWTSCWFSDAPVCCWKAGKCHVPQCN